MRKFWKQSGK